MSFLCVVFLRDINYTAVLSNNSYAICDTLLSVVNNRCVTATSLFFSDTKCPLRMMNLFSPSLLSSPNILTTSFNVFPFRIIPRSLSLNSLMWSGFVAPCHHGVPWRVTAMSCECSHGTQVLL